SPMTPRQTLTLARRRLLVTLALVALAAPSLRAADPPPPDKAVAVRAAKPIVMDGLLDDPIWKDAPPQGGFYLFGGNGQRVSDTTFRLACDDAWLYIGVECLNKDLRALQPRVSGHDKQACLDDSVEVFLDPGTEGGTYFHYMLSYAGARDERRISGPKRELEWDMPWRAATATRENGWTAEIAIPLCAIAAYEQLSAVTINLARNKRVPVIDSQNVVIEEKAELSSWAPVSSTFHEPKRFLPIAGLPAPLKPRAPLLARISKAQVQPYYVKAGQSFYDLDLEITGFTDQSGALQITVLDQPLSGQPREITQKVKVADKEKTRLRVTVPVAALCARSASVTLKDPARNEVYETAKVEDMSPLNTMSAYLDRNYYTSETEAVVVCRAGLPPEALKGLSLEARASGKALATLGAVSRQSRLAIPLAGLPLGVTPVEIVLLGQDKAPLFTAPIKLTKRAPKPGLEWKIDQERLVVLNNGKPFVPFGMVMSGVKADNEAAFDKLAAHNLNTFVVWARATPEDMALFNKNAASRGLYVVTSPGECGAPIQWEALSRYSGPLLERIKNFAGDGSNLSRLRGIITLPISVAERNAIYAECYRKNLPRFLQAVNNVKSAQNLAAYFILDEPMPQRLLDECAIGQDFYARIHAADGYHPVMVNYSSYIPDGDQYTDWCDILATDPYWIPPAAEGTRTTPNHVSKITWM
ncbi:MAG TPA: sugar-binding protein, partial [Candidatus Brocadiia bacterium]|nr:sugar-binding protein [Candidatus Brocadiia bacterium]